MFWRFFSKKNASDFEGHRKRLRCPSQPPAMYNAAVCLFFYVFWLTR